MKYPVARWDLSPVGPEFGAELEEIASQLGLVCKRSTTKSLPANFHWHFSLPGHTGVLEATWVFESGEAWLNVRSNRRGDWIPATLDSMLERLGRPNP